MRITILAIGTHGDAQPAVALGLGLQAKGHRVRIATHASFEPLVQRHGLTFGSVAPDPHDQIENNTGRSWRDSHHNGLHYLMGLRKLAARVMQQRVATSWAACQDADAIITSPLALLTGYHIAEKRNIPLIRAFYAPVTPTRVYPPNFMPMGMKLGGPINRLTHQGALQLFWLAFRGQVNAARRSVLDLPSLPWREPFGAMDRQHVPLLYGYSPTVLPPPADWNNATHVTGYWFLESKTAWQPPADFQAFLTAGPPPVYVGFGSMTNQNAAEVAHLVVQALAQVGARGVLLTGWGGLTYNQSNSHATDHTTGPVADHVYVLESAPHEVIFPQMALVVHHGGAGTIANSLRAGVPVIVIPFLPDQLFWGRRIHELGVGPRPILRRQLTVERLAEAIATTLHDPAMKQRAEALGQHIRAENGVGNAVRVIERYLAQYDHARVRPSTIQPTPHHSAVQQ